MQQHISYSTPNCMHDHVTPALQELHWLPVAERFQYKLCLLVHKTMLGHTTDYITDLLTPVADIPAWSSLRVSCRGSVNVPRTVVILTTELSLLLHCRLGMGCRHNSSNCVRQRHSDKKLKTRLFCLTYGAESTAVLLCNAPSV